MAYTPLFSGNATTAPVSTGVVSGSYKPLFAGKKEDKPYKPVTSTLNQFTDFNNKTKTADELFNSVYKKPTTTQEVTTPTIGEALGISGKNISNSINSVIDTYNKLNPLNKAKQKVSEAVIPELFKFSIKNGLIGTLVKPESAGLSKADSDSNPFNIFNKTAEKLAKDEPLTKEDADNLSVIALGLVDFGASKLPKKTKPLIEEIKSNIVAEAPEVFSPIQKVIDALKAAGPVSVEQKALYSAERSKRLAAALNAGKDVEGRASFYAQKAKLKGELPSKADFKPLESITEDDITGLFKIIEDTPALYGFDKLNAKTSLLRLIDEGKVISEREINLLGKAFPDEFIQTILDKRTSFDKLKTAGKQLWNLPKSLNASYDLSFGFRQGSFVAPTFRKEWFKAFTEQFGNFKSQKVFDAAQKAITEHKYYPLAVESKLALTDTGLDLAAREEQFASSWAEKLPGKDVASTLYNKTVGAGIRASSRAYTGMANKLRMDIFGSLADDATRLGLDLNKSYNEGFGIIKSKAKPLSQEIASWVNNATGRGSLGELEKSSTVLNSIFFSPRLMSSRLMLLNPIYYAQASPFIRKQALKSLFTYAGTVGTVLTGLKLSGLDVETDSNSADWAKIQVGDTRVDLLAGFQQYIRMASQLITGKYVSTITGSELTVGEGYKPITRKDIIQRQFESKLAPTMSFINNILKGQDYTGQPIELKKELISKTTPLLLQDMYDLAKTDPKLFPLELLSAFGIGVQTYLPSGGGDGSTMGLPGLPELPQLPKLPEL